MEGNFKGRVASKTWAFETLPLIRCHDVIESPDSVSRVAPPRTTAPRDEPAIKYSHLATAGLSVVIASATIVACNLVDCLTCPNRGFDN